MEKVVRLLEQYVQWLAVALGVMWLLLMTWWYVLTPPASVMMGNDSVTAGEVDERTQEGAATELAAELDRDVVPPMPVEDFIAAFESRDDWNDTTRPMLASGAWYSQPAKLGLPIGPLPQVPAGKEQTQQPEEVRTASVGEIRLPPLVPDARRAGRSVVLIGGGEGQQQNEEANAASAAREEDRDWVTQWFTVSLQQLSQSLQKGNVPQDAQTAFLDVEMQREELLPDGKWGNGKIVPPAGSVAWRETFPESGKPGAKSAYVEWAVENTKIILQPPFYEVARGDIWGKKAVARNAQATNTDVEFDPSTFDGNTADLSPAQRKQLNDFRRQQAREQQDARRQAPRRGAARGGGARGGFGLPPGYRSAKDDERAIAYLQAPSAEFLKGLQERMRSSMRGGAAAAKQPQSKKGGNTPRPAATDRPEAQPDEPYQPGEVPVGRFVPGEFQGDKIELWAHDDTVEAGKTYRYRARYRILNPATGNAKGTAKQFDLVSDWSGWGKSVTVPRRVNFFVAQNLLEAGTVKFDVFSWQSGNQKLKSFSVAPGDAIGSKQRDGDFSTGWTVVDVRSDPRTGEQEVVLVDEAGNAIVRSFDHDREDPTYRQLRQEVTQANQPTAAAQ